MAAFFYSAAIVVKVAQPHFGSGELGHLLYEMETGDNPKKLMVRFGRFTGKGFPELVTP